VPTLTINHYSLKLTSDSGVVVTRDNLNGVASMDVTPGNWTLQVAGYDGANVVVATGTKTVTFVEGNNAVTLTLIAATSKVASGTISLDIAWTSDSYYLSVKIIPVANALPTSTKARVLARKTTQYDLLSFSNDYPQTFSYDVNNPVSVTHASGTIDFNQRTAKIDLTVKSGTYQVIMEAHGGDVETASQIVQVVDGATSFKRIRDQGLLYGIAHSTELPYNEAAFSGSLTGQALGAQGKATYYHFHVNQSPYSDRYLIEAKMPSQGSSQPLGYSQPVGYLYDSDGVFVIQGDGQPNGTAGIWSARPKLTAGDYYLRMSNSFLYGGTTDTFDLSLSGDTGG